MKNKAQQIYYGNAAVLKSQNQIGNEHPANPLHQILYQICTEEPQKGQGAPQVIA